LFVVGPSGRRLTDPGGIVSSGHHRKAAVDLTLGLVTIVDVFEHLRRVQNNDSSPAWQLAVARACELAQPVCSSAPPETLLVHSLGVNILAISLFVLSHEREVRADQVPPAAVVDLLDEVASDTMWAPEWPRPDMDTSGPSDAWLPALEQRVADRDARVERLRTRLATGLANAGVDLSLPDDDDDDDDLRMCWGSLQHGAPPSNDDSLSGPPYTWRAHLPEAAIRATEYLTTHHATVRR
jgi:hypothetical protein